MGHYGQFKKLVSSGWEKFVCFPHIDLLLFGSVDYICFSRPPVRPRGHAGWQILYTIVACSVVFLVFYVPSTILFSRAENGSARLDVHGLDLEDLESLSRRRMNHIPIDLYDGNPLQKRNIADALLGSRAILSGEDILDR